MASESKNAGDDESRYRDYFDLSPDGVFVANSKGRYLEVNEAACRMTGYGAEELTQMSIPDLLAPEAQDKDSRRFQRLIETGRSTGERLCRRKDGTRFYMAIDVVKTAEDRFVAFCKDTTARRHTEEALRTSEELFQTLLRNTQGIVFMIDRAGVFVLSEGKGLATLGLEPGEVVGTSALEMYREIPAVVRGIEAALAGETVNSIVDINGPIYDSFYSPYRDADGEIAGMIGMATDITAREHAVEQRLRVAEEAQKAQKLESLGVLAGGIAHDFNNLLVSVLGSADLMQRELAPSSSLHRSSERIVDAARQAAALCEQLLAYAGKGRFEIEAIDVSAAVREMIPLLEVAVSKKVSITWDLAGDMPQVDADGTQIRQIAMNLVSNASEAIGGDVGTIRARTGAREYSAEELRAYVLADDRSPGRYVYLEVADSGCGMDSETRARMFDPFFTTKFTGRGLGMATVLGIVQRHRGAIRIDSAPGRGCTVTVLLSARDSAAPQLEPPTPLATDVATGTVLLVDDEETVRVTVSMMLEEAGFDVVTACDGVDALEKAARHGSSLRCVLLDVTMPRMSGTECLRALRQIAPTLPVVLSSGYSEVEISAQVGADGNTSFIHKPYRFEELTAKLSAVLRGAS